MTEAPASDTISTRLQRIADRARAAPDMAFNNLSYLLDMDLLREAFSRTRKKSAPGVDGQTAADYAVDLDANLENLLLRVKSGTYRAPAVRRVHIPKDGGKTRPIGIPTFEDKVLQRAVAMTLSAIYEQDFLDCSYGFRPGRSAHQALQKLWEVTMAWGGGWVLEVDIQGFFDHLDHRCLREILDLRVRDKGLRRLIGKWMKAGVLEGGSIAYPAEGTPQGGVISPLLANAYLHEVLDLWFYREVKPRMRGRTELIRYADDFLIIFQFEQDAKRVAEVLPKRFGRFGLSLNQEKTRLVPFHKAPAVKGSSPEPESFDFLGFTHFWGRSRAGRGLVRRKTARKRLARGLKRVNEWCRRNRHLPIRKQWEALCRKLKGHYGYYGVTSNYRVLAQFWLRVARIWQKWLGRRSQRAKRNWDWMASILKRFPLPRPIIAHSYLRAAKPVS